jgi:hypothetical protein
LGEGLSDRKPIGEAEESEVGVVEPRILPKQIQEALKVHGVKYTTTIIQLYLMRTGFEITSFVWERVITSYRPMDWLVYNITRRIISNTIY